MVGGCGDGKLNLGTYYMGREVNGKQQTTNDNDDDASGTTAERKSMIVGVLLFGLGIEEVFSELIGMKRKTGRVEVNICKDSCLKVTEGVSGKHTNRLFIAINDCILSDHNPSGTDFSEELLVCTKVRNIWHCRVIAQSHKFGKKRMWAGRE